MSKSNVKWAKKYSKSSIKFDYDMTDVVEKFDILQQKYNMASRSAMLEVIPEMIKAVAKYTPPCIGKQSIQKKYYFRPIIQLKKSYGKKIVAQDIEQIKKGMRFKVLNTKSEVKKGTVFAYCKTLAQAKKASKIKNRGISRVMWGQSLHDLGINVPNTILRLRNKSKDMTHAKLSSSELQVKNNGNILDYTFVNNVENIDRYSKLSMNYGLKKLRSLYSRKMKQKLTNI